MKIGYFADGIWAQRALLKIINDYSIKVMFIVGRYKKRDIELIKLAKEYNIPVELSDDVNSPEFISKMKNYNPDLFVSMSFDQIFKREMINLPKYKTINCHAGKLPFYRGRNVLNWVLINDEKEFGITVHYVDEKIDTGDIILQKTYPITDEDDYCSLLERAYDGCADMLYNAIKKIQYNEVMPLRQVDIDPIGMYCGMRQEGDEIIDWSQNSRDVFNFIRALCIPGPQAISWIKGKKILINRSQIVQGSHKYKNIPGQVVGKSANSLFVKTGDTMLEILDYTYSGKINIGDRLVNHE